MNNLRKVRRSLDMTQEQLAEIVDSSKGYISDLENGKISAPLISRCYAISNALGVDVQAIFPNEKH